MKLFRKLLFWSHLAAGVIAGVVVLIMSVTGVLLTYQRQMQLWADTRHYQYEPSAGATPLAPAALIEAAQAVDPATPATTVTLRSDGSAPAAVALGTKTIFLNPYTGHVYGEGTGAGMRAFFSQMVVWHRYLAMSGESRPTGRAITGASNLLFLFIVLSGMYLWWPRVLSVMQFRNIVWFRRGLRPKARNFNWHNVLGFWSALPLALVVYSGVIISYPWASNMVYRVMGEEPPAPAAGRGAGPGAAGGGRGQGRGAGEGGPSGRGAAARSVATASVATGAVAGASAASAALPEPRAAAAIPSAAARADVDVLVARAKAYQPDWTIITARVPAAGAATTTVTMDRGDGGQPHLRGTLTLNAKTGEVTNWDGYSTQTPGRRARSFLRFAHTGEVGGLIGQTIAGVVSAAAIVLVYTGLALSLRRLREWIGRRGGAAVVREPAA